VGVEIQPSLVKALPTPTTLAIGASYTQTQLVALPADSAGDSHIIVVTDFDQSLAELSYANNAGSAAIALT
jgi:hypothetical protein